MTKPARSLEFDSAAFEDLAWWVEQDRSEALRIIKLIKDVQRDPFHGVGKPEPLKRDLPVVGLAESTENIVLFIK